MGGGRRDARRNNGKTAGGRGKGRGGGKGAAAAPDARGPEGSVPGVQPAAAKRGGRGVLMGGTTKALPVPHSAAALSFGALGRTGGYNS